MTAPGSDRHQQQVAALREGTVIDHLNPGGALRAVQVLGLSKDGAALLGVNLESEKLGRKDILKLENVELSQRDIDRIAIFGPEATVSYIRDYEVQRKVSVKLPDDIVGILKCPNPNCITNHERVETRLHVDRRQPLLMHCSYCERRILEDEALVL